MRRGPRGNFFAKKFPLGFPFQKLLVMLVLRLGGVFEAVILVGATGSRDPVPLGARA